MKIAIGNDHAALELKNHIVDYLVKEGHEVVNFGTDTPASTDYPIYGARVAHAVANGECERGVVICGTGSGISDVYKRQRSKRISYAKSRPTRLLQFLKYSGALKLSQNQMERYFGDAMAKLGLTYDTIPKLK